jgi:hypothetical protein
LFLGVPSIGSFDYDRIREFAAQAVRVAAQVILTDGTIAMTIHGVGYGLDEHEAFRAQLEGLRSAFSMPDVKKKVRKIAIIERELERARRLQDQLNTQDQ